MTMIITHVVLSIQGMRENSLQLGVSEENYRIFCEMLVQRPLLFRAKNGVPLAKGLSQYEMQYMKNMAAQRLGSSNLEHRENIRESMDWADHFSHATRFDEIMACLKALPRPMLLVFRNINTVRSIAKTHGHPVDRFAIMAREANFALFARSSIEGR